jgi:putative nucleotidyltransferase with HDIG domain
MYCEQRAGNPARIFMALSTGNLTEDGLLVAEVDDGYLWEAVGRTLPQDMQISIVDSTGRQLFATLELAGPVIAQLQEESRRSSNGRLMWQKADTEFFANYWTVFLTSAFIADPLTVVVSAEKKAAMQPVSAFFRAFALAVLLTLLIIIFVSSIQIRQSLTPLALLSEYAGRISQGDFAARVSLKSGDEFETLGNAFNAMSARLKEQFQGILDSGAIIRRILAAKSREEVVEEVHANLRGLIPCDWIGLLLFDSADGAMARCYYSDHEGTPGIVSQHSASISSEEMHQLRSVDGYLHVADCGSFSSYFMPLTEGGCGSMFLLPIIAKNQLLGGMALGIPGHAELDENQLESARQVADQIAVALENIRLIQDLDELNWGTISALATTVDAKSSWTAGHSERVTQIALRIGRAMGLNDQDLNTLHLAGMFHDIGKIGVSESLLDKPGKLTDTEYEEIKSHSAKGAEILSHIKVFKEVVPIVRQHHEWFNGQGYPDGVAGDAIVLGARILAVADVYDALVSDRPYRAGWDHWRACDYIQEKSGSQFDPRVVELFIALEKDGNTGSMDGPVLEPEMIEPARRVASL